ncbi:TonB-dependent siderophore receptor [Methylobacterium durans]|uniref:TonB-dependent siderophore receptor n=1 Tax=Methylobacterium durans TaxID=2202825 RepID=UPI002AFF335A|nr:TonB-dependent siderophore receptor [Methylobacterium durans]MEA1833659.1 TonB-dependent siderophore receptor [Methylobacterium durans]
MRIGRLSFGERCCGRAPRTSRPFGPERGGQPHRARLLSSVAAIGLRGAFCTLAAGVTWNAAEAQQVGAAVTLETLSVAGAGAGGGPPGESAYGPVQGFVATRSATATKTDTPLIETPESIAIVTADQIATQQALSLGETLNYVAGVSGTVNTASDTRCGGFQIRGFDVTSNSVYRDGLRLPGTSQADFNCLDPYGAERIEILKGPASVLYGQNGPGGVINYVSKRPLFTSFGEVSLLGGSFDRVQGEFDFGGPVDPQGQWAYRLTGVVRQSGNQIDFVNDDRVFIAPAVTWRPDADTTLTVLANYQRDRAGWGLQFLPALGTVTDNLGRFIPRNRFVGIPGLDRYDTDQASIGYLFEHRFSDDLIVRQNARFSYLRNDQILAYGSGYTDPVVGDLARTGGAGRSVLHTFAIDNQAQVRFATGPFGHTMLFGLDYRSTGYTDSLSSFGVDPINVFRPVYTGPTSPITRFQDLKVGQDQVGLYLQDQIRFDRFTLVLGGRSDWADTTVADRFNATRTDKAVQAFTGKAGLIYNFDNGVAPYVSYSESFLPVLNVDLNGRLFEPESGRQYEVGVKYQPPGFRGYFTAAAFDLTRQNVIRFDAVNATFAARQTGEINSRGVELESVVSLTDGLNVRAAYAYIDAEITKDPDGGNAGRVPVTVPRHRISVWGDYTLQTGDWRGFQFGGGIRFVGSTFGDDANTFKVPSATVLDSVISYTRGNYRLSINATNLLDKHYVASCFTADFGCFYAEGRRVIAKLTYRW